MGAGLRAGLPAAAGQKHRWVKRCDDKMTIKEQETNYRCGGHNLEIINKLSYMSDFFFLRFFFYVHPPLIKKYIFIYIALITY